MKRPTHKSQSRTKSRAQISKKVNKILTKEQLKLLNIGAGEKLDPAIWSPDIASFFSKPNKLNIYSDDRESLSEYLAFVKDPAFVQPSQDRNKIALLEYAPINKKKFNLEAIMNIMNAFYPPLNFVASPYKACLLVPEKPEEKQIKQRKRKRSDLHPLSQTSLSSHSALNLRLPANRVTLQCQVEN